ncbi:hypothetical protein M422DRAFT_277183 [Sphaerobolus stellatus SS14]|uniref:Uncharacterized protein n=1 Tax=Sphaerobolus stellatus (strain SS14) TaxID=990650 RepID=A0A0C9T106_SPHS4|nr:hypothetical protein M422DRAFT_277183 [Sphaerobolus stellatus SS14]
MISLASTSVLPDFEAKKELIRQDSKEARDWLYDKEVGSPYTFPGLYFPLSKMPLTIWQASPHTTNGNEQAHRTINRDGIGTSLLAAIFHVRTAKRKLNAVDEQLTALYQQVDELTESIQSLVQILQMMDRRSRDFNISAQRLQVLQHQYHEVCQEAETLGKSSSGTIEIRHFDLNSFLFDPSLIAHLSPIDQSQSAGSTSQAKKPRKPRKTRKVTSTTVSAATASQSSRTRKGTAASTLTPSQPVQLTSSQSVTVPAATFRPQSIPPASVPHCKTV